MPSGGRWGYGDHRLEIELNGQLVTANASVVSARRLVASPNSASNHSIFELSFRASPGGFGVQLHDPGPAFGCDVLETEPASLFGELSSGGGIANLRTGTDFDGAVSALPPSNFCRELDALEGTADDSGRRLSAPIISEMTGAGFLPPTPVYNLLPAPVSPPSPSPPPLSPTCTSLPAVSPNARQNADWEAGIGSPSARQVNPRSTVPHVVDGAFTGWTGARGQRRLHWLPWPAVARHLPPLHEDAVQRD